MSPHQGMKKIDFAAYGTETEHDGAWKFFRDLVRDLLANGQSKTYDSAATRALEMMQALSADHRVYSSAGGGRDDASSEHGNGFDAIAKRLQKTSEDDTMVMAGVLDDDDASF